MIRNIITEDDGRDVARFREAVRSLLSDVEELPSRADDFARSVEEKAGAILQTVERTGRATAAQDRAIERMHAGVRRWLR